ncbi:MAG: YlxR family protein [Candidatus Eremiobacteraeota bacterium]|nr:YlxR family protein [Candidatus Eremiobacteraeota bacterium]
MASPHEPERTCVGCRERKPQHSMRRFVRLPEGWKADEGRKQAGRGAYLCSHACAERVKKNKRFPGLANIAAATVF